MSRDGIKSTTWLTAGAAVAGFLCLGVIVLLVASTIVLGLIPLYLPNHGDARYGEQFRIQVMVMKAVYHHDSSESLNGTVLDSMFFSTLCGTAYRNQDAKDFAGCLATNFTAFDSNNTNSYNKRRRRRAPTAGLYEVGEISLYYSTACAHHTDAGKRVTSDKLNSCLKRRLTACDSFRDGSSHNVSWTQSSGPFAQTIVTKSGSVAEITVHQIYALPIARATELANTTNQSNTTSGEIQLGCEYVGPLPLEVIASRLSSQSATTIAPDSSSPNSG